MEMDVVSSVPVDHPPRLTISSSKTVPHCPRPCIMGPIPETLSKMHEMSAKIFGGQDAERRGSGDPCEHMIARLEACCTFWRNVNTGLLKRAPIFGGTGRAKGWHC